MTISRFSGPSLLQSACSWPLGAGTSRIFCSCVRQGDRLNSQSGSRSARRKRLAWQLLSESSVLATAGGLVGTMLAWAGMLAWRARGPEDFPQLTTLALNGPALLFALAMSGLTALACGLIPAWFASREIAHHQGARVTAGRRHAAVRRTFVAVQLACATVLLIGMGVVARGFARLEQVSPGFTPDGTLSLQLSLPPQMYGNRAALVQFNEALRDRMRSLPDVGRAGLVSLLPLSGLLSTIDIAFPNRPAPPPDEVPQAHFRVASPEYFDAAGIPILEGRAFSDSDLDTSLPVAIVSRTFAERHWPGRSAVGESVQIVQAATSAPMQVVGVVGDVKHFTLDAAPTADLYVPLHQMPASQASLLAARTYWIVRGRAGAVRLGPAVRAAVAQVDPNVATSSERTLEAVWSVSLGSRRMNVTLLEVFGQVALVLCGLGVYGVASFSARARKRELAIRTALGASRTEVTSGCCDASCGPRRRACRQVSLRPGWPHRYCSGLRSKRTHAMDSRTLALRVGCWSSPRLRAMPQSDAPAPFGRQTLCASSRRDHSGRIGAPARTSPAAIRHAHPTRNATPPSGVIAPSTVMRLSASA